MSNGCLKLFVTYISCTSGYKTFLYCKIYELHSGVKFQFLHSLEALHFGRKLRWKIQNMSSSCEKYKIMYNLLILFIDFFRTRYFKIRSVIWKKESLNSWKLGSWDLLMEFSTKINLLCLLYSTAQRCCLLHLNQNCWLKTFLRTLILMTQVSLYLFSLLPLIWNSVIVLLPQRWLKRS